ncbi:MAG: peptide-methionine (S)-S-oxide reductase MsrA [Candidatus Pristimantibacillus sp.]
MTAYQTVTLGMGCFWSPDALFGHLPGVIRTSVGYAGGNTDQPTYRQMGDHTETVQIQFDPETIPLEHLIEVFWNNHNPININDYKGRQYRSLLFYNDEQQLEAINKVIAERKERDQGEPATEIAPYSCFFPAEDRHQKYYLKRYPDAIDKLSSLYPRHEDLINTTLVARLNGLAKGYTSLERIKNEIKQWKLNPDERSRLLELISGIRW